MGCNDGTIWGRGGGDSAQHKHSLHDFSESAYAQPVTHQDAGREQALLELLWGEEPALCLAFVWSGHANESSRVKAGARLAERIKALIPRGSEIAVAGHSHGGNVIGHALDQDRSLRFAKTYLFSTPFFGSWGHGKWRGEPEVRYNAGEKLSFVHPADMIQTVGASMSGFYVAYSDCPDFRRIEIQPDYQARFHGQDINGANSHTSMSSTQAFVLAKRNK